MCIVVDANVIGSVMDKKAVNHLSFKPVLDWVINGKGKFVIGGTKYLKECRKYLPIFTELARVKKTVTIDNNAVDTKAEWASKQIVDPDFDDQHLIGLLLESGCKLICSLDARAYPFFRHPIFFAGVQRPKIYSRQGNNDLLTDANIADVCKPNDKLTVLEKGNLKTL